ncbi:6-hydroxy-3-succinoylpyridine 3-monooxygenase HspB [Pigmentiphaga humi]|uniref:6-hydroxy-3-succinoylpyridine 3-monooxygenase HspB n=1 Tax=Pigmentiphaga humi TaxID=2478468 RepID=A0A3P4AZB9_9BURK|nr:6-hydroxy-3-succinoylpyridine 3-monooxygenase HspB [Pigmentiphaga humi]
MSLLSEKKRVIVVGAGPVGLVTAARLGHAGIDVTVVEADLTLSHALKASTFHPPTLDMLDEFGITSKLLDAGLKGSTWQVRMHATGEFAQFDLSALRNDTSHPYRLQVEQWRLVELMLDHIKTRLPGVEVLMGHKCVAVDQTPDEASVTVELADGERKILSGSFVVAADGARSAIRQLLDLPFEGLTFPEATILVLTDTDFKRHIPDLSNVNYCWSEQGTFSLLKLVNRWRVSLYPWEGESLEEALEPQSIEAKLQLIAPQNQPYRVMEIRPYRIHQRVVNNYVHGRIALAGDAAHINSPSGGMGMNGGIHDAFNLSDKLRRIYAGESMALLELYDRQRRPIAIKHVLEQSGRNRARMQEGDKEKRQQILRDLKLKAENPEKAYAYLLETSMIAGLRESASIV